MSRYIGVIFVVEHDSSFIKKLNYCTLNKVSLHINREEQDMHVPDRAYGIETEYACMLKKDNTVLDSAQWPYDFLSNYIHQHADRTSCVLAPYSRVWHSNASLSYIDTGNHPEHASAEARSVREAVLYSRAGDKIMQDLFYTMPTDALRVFLFKNNIGPDCDDTGTMRTFGCHENYSTIHETHNHIWEIYNHKSFIPFIVSRQIFDGTGSWDNHGKFFLSQRARCVGSWRSIPLSVNVKFSEGSPRVHMTYGDSSILDMAAFLKIGTMSLVLSLMEGRCLPDIVCADPMRSLLDVSQHGPQERVVYLRSGEHVSAHDIQVRYWETARHACRGATFDSDEVAAETEIILIRWEQALNAIAAHDIGWMIGQIDWATKQWLVQKEIARSGNHDTVAHAAIRSTIDLCYHSFADGCMRDRIYTRFPERRLCTDEEIIHACVNSPVGTRAKTRATVIRMATAQPSPLACAVIDWHRVSFNTNKGFYEFKMDDPLNPYENYIKAIEKNFQNCGPIMPPREDDMG